MKKNNYLSISKSLNDRLEKITTAIKASLLGLLFLIAVSPTFAQKLDSTPQTIKGVVLSGEDSTALDGANIILKGTGVGTIADKQGRFVFPQQLKEGDVLLISFVGQQTQEYKVPAHAEGEVVIQMKIGFDLNGDLVVSEIYTKPIGRHKLLSKIKRLL